MGNIKDAKLENGDTLANPLHKEGGELQRFDLVLSNPPFSQNYTQDGLPFPERFAYGMCPDAGKTAGPMVCQHRSAGRRGRGTAGPGLLHGCPRRGGAEGAAPRGWGRQAPAGVRARPRGLPRRCARGRAGRLGTSGRDPGDRAPQH